MLNTPNPTLTDGKVVLAGESFALDPVFSSYRLQSRAGSLIKSGRNADSEGILHTAVLRIPSPDREGRYKLAEVVEINGDFARKRLGYSR